MAIKLRRRTVITGIAGLPFLVCGAAMKCFGADSRVINLRLLRQYASEQCTAGQLSMDGFIGYTLERHWEGNLPLISSIPTGTFNGFVRTRTSSRWRIELVDVPGRDGIQIHIGNFIPDGIGCVLLGSNVSLERCTLDSSQSAMEKFKLAFNSAAARYGQSDVDTPVKLTVSDH